MIAIIDYGMGNLRSVQKAFEAVGAEAVITADKAVLDKAAGIVLPGVGAVRPAMARLNELGFVPVIKEQISSGKPFLGICLGYQLLFETSTEGGDVKALGVLAGTVERFPSLKVPQMGWNELLFPRKDCSMFQGVPEGAFVYFCHSYYVKPKDITIASALTDYGLTYASAVCSGNVWGVQFHPEKSQKVGLQVLKNFMERV